MPSHFKRQEPLFPRKLLVTSQKVIVGADDRWAQDRGRSSDKSSRWDYRTGRITENISFLSPYDTEQKSYEIRGLDWG
ncbi:hypothetical protein CDAR_76651 [Caerostris darwini]|uniref:Ycf15 n=1 Tax=Caerostris darwini TaxID=1538125 RepID=A0AAV4QFM3_9ARAC|nr:hypothetical protein CDAR_76651 [Caerostris darwini]